MFERAWHTVCILLAAQMLFACEGGALPAPGAEADAGPDAAPDAGPDAAPDAGPDAAPPVDAEPVPRIPGELVEDPSVYDQDDLQVRVIHLTVTDLAGLEAVHANVPGAEVNVLFQGDGVGEGVTRPNGKMRLRGATARLAEQKSYRIKLFSKTELWHGHRVIHLNKHQYDLARVRQKLSFDYFEEIRHLTSLRTSFVRFYINGEDMGFFTQIERPAQRFLFTHGLDPAGQLYKATSFLFEEIPEEAWHIPEMLDSYLEVKANPNHAKLREMLAAVRDESRDIDAVIDTYFHRENYLTWWAANILMSNFDTVYHNYMLYSPSDSRRWYFLPWDYDDTWGAVEQPAEPPHPRSSSGIGNWWWPPLHQRFLRKQGNAEELVHVVEHLAHDVITPEHTAALLAQYHDIVRANVEVPPDIVHLPALGAMSPEDALAMFEDEYARVPGTSEQYLDELYASLHWPMPVWIWRAEAAGNQVSFAWSESFDLQGDAITYDLLVSTSPRFEDSAVVERRTLLVDRQVTMTLPPGVYFARVIARDGEDPAEHWQQCSNALYVAADNMLYWGLVRVEVKGA